ncbi:MAG: response regulator [Chitinophagales bacterium]|nr:response regulator [Chitinophagales bacterium]
MGLFDPVENRSILIIDDEKEICILLAKIIEKNGMRAIYVHSLEDALGSIDKINPPLIFLDINLPDGSGIDFLSRLSIQYPEIQVVIISAYDDYKTKAVELGAIAFLIKPFSKQAVVDILSNCLNHA